MVMVASIAMAVTVIVVPRDGLDLADTGAFPFTQRAAFRQPLHVVMVAFLGSAHILFKTQHLSPVLTERTIHRGVAAQRLLHPFAKRVDHFRVITQVPR